MHILFIAQNFLLVCPYFQRLIFRSHWPLPIALRLSFGTVAPYNFWRLKMCLPTFWSMSIMAKRLGGSGYHLVRSYASAQVTLSQMETHLPTERGTATPTFRPTALAHIPAGPHFTHNPFCRLRGRLSWQSHQNCHPSSFFSDLNS